MKVKILLLCLFNVFLLNAQKIYTFESDTNLFEDYFGKLKFSHYLDADSNSIKNGVFTFNSNQRLELDSNTLKIKSVNLKGNFTKNQKDKNWEYLLKVYDVKINDIKGSWKYNIDYNLDGSHYKYLYTFKNGIPVGNWTLRKNSIKNSIIQKEKTLASLTFKNGILVNDFNYDKETKFYGNVKIKGKLNDTGFFDGNLSVQYQKDGIKIEEKRIYDNGFLLYLSKKDITQDTLIIELEYEDVTMRLEKLKENDTDLNFTTTDQGFGLFFNNGYKEDNIKNKVQLTGNSVLNDFFNTFNHCFINDISCFTTPIYNLTKRFKFIYPETDDSITVLLRHRVDTLLKKAEHFTESPKYVLNKEKTDTLKFNYKFVSHSLKKIKLIDDVISKIEDHYFDFLYRPNYYQDGVNGLNKIDTIVYEFNDEKFKEPYDIGILIKSPENLLLNLNKYLDTLEIRNNKYIDITNSKIKLFERQETIDSIDAAIVSKGILKDSLFNMLDEEFENNNKDLNEMPFSFRVYKSLNNRIIEKLNRNYIELETYNEKVEIGSEIICLLDFLLDEYDYLNSIDDFNKWLSTQFTILQRNPFDRREFEVKILGNIERAGRILVENYSNEILRANSCKNLNQNLKSIKKVKELLTEFVNKNDDDAQKINRALRRENMPSRIERIIGL